eukprot:6197543-Pleurochrysis_carterae.AAC.2
MEASKAANGLKTVRKETDACKAANSGQCGQKDNGRGGVVQKKEQKICLATKNSQKAVLAAQMRQPSLREDVV